ncbi:putative polypeptide N-acetylgalactosaminyltransferase 9 [Bulinus truncatus]|nr:putative polypeptide N-acetylgalactosaminyltransferase 9 [Bulinus truncatus]
MLFKADQFISLNINNVIIHYFFNLDHLKDPLEAYIKPLSKVKLFRSSKRLGLIKARNYAFEYSKGKIVIFLDSHIECYPGWIEPLLAPILNDSRVITYPTIEIISGTTFGTAMNSKLERTVGGLMLNSLSFNWLYDRKHNVTSRSLYYQSPTMPGGLYAVSRDWFSKLGKNDPEMEYWGGENIEMSFKTWMCGGSLLLSLCSHVGHIFRNSNPNLKGIHMTYKNPVRVAEVWMDRFKHYFYEKLAYNIPHYGNITSRVEIKKSLQCQNFGWYLTNVYPELAKKMDIAGVYYGEIKTVEGTACLTRQENWVNIDACRLGAVTQQWQLGTDQRVVSGDFILAARMETKSGKEKLELMLVHDRGIDQAVHTTWKYEKQKIIHVKTGMCLEASLHNRNVELKLCLASSELQKWNMTTRAENKNLMRNRGVNIDWSV